MRLEDLQESSNIADRRGEGGFGGGGGGFGIPIGGGGLGSGTVVVLGLIGWALGIDPSVLIGGAEILSGGQQTRYEQPYRPEQRRAGRPTDATGDFVAAVLGDTEDRWTEIFQASGQHYRAPKLRLFAGSEPTPCAYAQSAMGPFYCPRDERVYLDTSFFRDLQTKFRGCESKACAFSEAYVIAHEVGHHVQNQLGILPKVQQAQQASGNKAEANWLQVRVELQADCLGGVWAHQARAKHDFLDPGDVDA